MVGDVLEALGVALLTCLAFVAWSSGAAKRSRAASQAAPSDVARAEPAPLGHGHGHGLDQDRSILVAGPVQVRSRSMTNGFTLTAQTARFTFYSRDGKTVDPSHSERYLSRVERLLGQSVAGRVSYFRYGTPEEVAAGTGVYASGVTFARSGQIHSTKGFHAHEIVHLVAGQMGDPGSFFQEGLAVAVGNEGQWNGQDVTRLARAWAKPRALESWIDDFDHLDAEVAYPAAGAFVGSLLHVYGPARVAEFFRACPSPRDREAAFRRVFGLGLRQAGRDWAAEL